MDLQLILQEEQAEDNFSPVKFQGGGRSVKGRRPKKLPHIPARDRYLSKMVRHGAPSNVPVGVVLTPPKLAVGFPLVYSCQQFAF